MSRNTTKILRFFLLSTLCALVSTMSYAQSDMPTSNAPSSRQETSSEADKNTELVPVRLGKYQLVIPREYFGTGTLSIQTTNHLVLDVQLPDIRPMTDEERNRFSKSGRLLPNTAHIILEENDRYVFGDQLFERFIKDGANTTPPFRVLSPEQASQSNMLVYHNMQFSRDIYLVKNSSPKFFFDCPLPNKFIVNPICKYDGQLIGNVRYQIWYNKNAYFNDIVTLTPKIKALLQSFIKP